MRVDFLTCSLTSLSLLFRANSSISGKLNFSCFDMLQNTFFRDSPVAEDKTCVPSQFTFSAFTFSLSLAARYDPAATVSSLEHWFPIEISIDLHCSLFTARAISFQRIVWFYHMGQVLQTKKIGWVSNLSRKGINANTLPKAKSNWIVYALERSHFLNLLHGLPVYFFFLSCVVVTFDFSVQFSFSQSNSFLRIRQPLSDLSFSVADLYSMRTGFKRSCMVQW